MNKNWMIGGIVGAVILGGALVVGADNNDDQVKNKLEAISIEQAESAALKEVSGEVEEVELEREGQKPVYKVEVENAGDDDTEVIVDAKTGTVLKIDEDDDRKVQSQVVEKVTNNDDEDDSKKKVQSQVYQKVTNDDDDDDDDYKKKAQSQAYQKVTKDDDDDDDANSNRVSNTTKQKPQTSRVISKEEAIKIAEVAVNGKVYEVERDEDDGRIEYELELQSSKGEVEVEIDGHTGKILEIDYED